MRVMEIQKDAVGEATPMCPGGRGAAPPQLIQNLQSFVKAEYETRRCQHGHDCRARERRIECPRYYHRSNRPKDE